jgi:hypothetical protein
MLSKKNPFLRRSAAAKREWIAIVEVERCLSLES